MHEVSGERRFAAPPERVFALLTDPDVIASAMPAVRSHEVIDRDHWRAKVKPPIPLAPRPRWTAARFMRWPRWPASRCA